MTIHYFDPSAWVKRHFQEAGSNTVNSLFRAPLIGACCRLGLLEMIATVARKSSQAALAKPVVDAILDNVKADFVLFQSVAVDDTRVDAAAELAMRHRLRTMDAIHLACAMALGTPGQTIMVSADAELLAAAAKEGLLTLNP